MYGGGCVLFGVARTVGEGIGASHSAGSTQNCMQGGIHLVAWLLLVRCNLLTPGHMCMANPAGAKDLMDTEPEGEAGKAAAGPEDMSTDGAGVKREQEEAGDHGESSDEHANKYGCDSPVPVFMVERGPAKNKALFSV